MSTLIVTTPDDLRTIVENAVTTALGAFTPPTPIEPPSSLLTRREAMTALRISAPTLRRQIRRGAIPIVKIGKRVLIRRSDLAAHIAKGGNV